MIPFDPLNIPDLLEPSDLNLNSPEQLALGEFIEHSGGLDGFMHALSINHVQLARLAGVAANIHQWQRWAYELDKSAKAEPESTSKQIRARLAWMFTKYIQDHDLYVKDMVENTDLGKDFLESMQDSEFMKKFKEFLDGDGDPDQEPPTGQFSRS